MTRSLRDLKVALLLETGRRLARFGYSSRPTGQTFYRRIDGGRVGIHLSFIQHECDFDVTVDVGIRFDAVEKLVSRSNRLISKQRGLRTSTLGAELGNLESGEPFRVTVSKSSDVELAGEVIESKIETVGLPYIEKYSRLEAAFSLLEKDEREVWIHSPFHSARAKRACALLAVMGRRDELRCLGAAKLSFLQSMNDPGVDAFSRFLEELQAERHGPPTG